MIEFRFKQISIEYQLFEMEKVFYLLSVKKEIRKINKELF